MKILPIKLHSQYSKNAKLKTSDKHQENLDNFDSDINYLKNKIPLKEGSIDIFESLNANQKIDVAHFINRIHGIIESNRTQIISSNYEISKEKKFSKPPIIKTCAGVIDKSGTIINLTQLIEGNKVKYEKNELQENLSISRFSDDEYEFFTKDTLHALKSQIIIKKDKKTKEPTHIISIKASKILNGTFDITKYTLKDYPQDYDVISHIEDDSIKGGEIISKSIICENGSIGYFENIPCDDMTIKRYYKKHPDDGYEYSFRIMDKDGNETLDIERSLRKISNTQSVTTINGKKYIATFDDTKRTITIEDYKGKRKTINIADKFKNAPKAMIIIANRLPEHQDILGTEKLWQTFKSMSADILLKFDDNINALIYSSYEAFSFPNKKLICSYNNLGVILHELGHCIGNKLENDKVLAKIYIKELTAFNNKFTHSSRQFIKYFTQEEKGNLEGLSEIIAETYMLSSICCYNTDFSSRAQILVHNFPKTISYIVRNILEN